MPAHATTPADVTAAAAAGAAPPAPPRQLVGDLAIWLVIAAELLTFALLFLSFAVMRWRHAALFSQGQQTLDLNAGAINTALLVCGSGCVARAVQAVRGPAPRRAAGWLLAALGCGAGFLALKSSEYVHQIAAGHDLSTDDFFMFYWLLTGFHYLHVVAAMVFLAALLPWALKRGPAPGRPHAVETAAAFWHMVDLLWIVLFPLVYVMR